MNKIIVIIIGICMMISLLFLNLIIINSKKSEKLIKLCNVRQSVEVYFEKNKNQILLGDNYAKELLINKMKDACLMYNFEFFLIIKDKDIIHQYNIFSIAMTGAIRKIEENTLEISDMIRFNIIVLIFLLLIFVGFFSLSKLIDFIRNKKKV